MNCVECRDLLSACEAGELPEPASDARRHLVCADDVGDRLALAPPEPLPRDDSAHDRRSNGRVTLVLEKDTVGP